MNVDLTDIYYFKSNAQSNNACLLRSVSAFFPALTINAVMGPSGAGKSEDCTARDCVAMVPERDLHIRELTVYENLYYSSLLRPRKPFSADTHITINRQPSDGSGDEEATPPNAIERATMSLGVDHLLDTVVGEGLSPGELRLLTIATEMLDLPAVLLFDDLFVGLDSNTSTNVMKSLHRLLSSYPCTVICTLSQPSCEVLQFVDNYLCLVEGVVAFNGSLRQMTEMVGVVMDTPYEVSTEMVYHFMDMLSDRERRVPVLQEWVMRKNISILTLKQSIRSVQFGGRVPEWSDTGRHERISFWHQVYTLAARHLLHQYRSKSGLATALTLHLVAGIVVGVLYYKNMTDMENLSYLGNPRTLLFDPITLNVIGWHMTTPLIVITARVLPVPVMYYMREIYDREQRNRLYHPAARWLAVNLVDLVLVLLTSSVYIGIVLWMMGTRGSLLQTCSILLMTALVAHAQVLLFTQLTSSPMRAFFTFGFWVIVSAMLAGYYVNRTDISRWLRPLLNTSFMHWTVGPLMRNTFEDLLPPQGETFLEYYSFENMHTLESLGVLTLFFVAFQILFFFSIRSYGFRNVKEVPKMVAQQILRNIRTPSEDSDLPYDVDGETVISPVFDISRDSAASSDYDDIMRSYFVSDSVDLYEDVASSIENYVPSLMEPYNQLDDFFPAYGDDDLSIRFKSKDFDISEVIKKLPQSRMVTLMFQNIGCVINEKAILKNISGSARPGELIAIMGSNGAGKSTLLNVLAGKIPTANISGDVYCNNKKLENMSVDSHKFSYPLFAYVQQGDTHCPLLTVRETVSYAVMLRLHVLDQDALWCTTENILRQLQLHDVGGSLVDTISTGQRRRLSIAVETSNLASLIFLDEVTSGLDSSAADAVVDVLRYLADSSRTVVCTIHQPHQNLFTRFDRLLVLSRGQCVYFGSTERAMDFFEDIWKPATANSADYIMSLVYELPEITNEEGALSVETLATRYREHMENEFRVSTESDHETHAVVSHTDMTDTAHAATRTGLFRREWITVYILGCREVLKEKRRIAFWKALSIRNVILGVITGLVWFQIEDGNYLSQIGMFILSYAMSMIWLLEICASLHLDKALFKLEHDANVTSVFASWLVAGLPVPLCIAWVFLCYAAPVYYLSGMRQDGARYFLRYLLLNTVGVIYNFYLHQLCVTLSANMKWSIILFPSFAIFFQIMFAGYSVSASTMNGWYSWGSEIDIAKWVLCGLFQNQFRGNGEALGYADFEDIVEQFHWRAPFWTCVVKACYLAIGTKVLVYVAMVVELLHKKYSRI